MSPVFLALVGVPVLVLCAIRWRRELLMALPFLAILNGVPLVFGGQAVRLDQLAACLLVIPLVAAVLAGRRRLTLDSTSMWLAASLVMNVVASVLNSPARTYSLLQCVNLASAWIIYFLLINFLDTRGEIDAFLRRCLWGAAAVAALGSVAFVLSLIGVSTGGADVSSSAAEALTTTYGAYGTMVEPNIFGSFSGAMFVLAVGILMAKPSESESGTPPRLLRVTAVLCAVGLVLSFTRSAWIGVFVGLVYLLIMGRRAIGLRVSLGMPLAVGTVLVIALLLIPGTAGNFLRFKFTNLVNLQSRTATLRLLTYALAIGQTVDHPVVGWGTFTFAPLVAQGTDFARFDGWRNIWIGNFLLLSLHDTGAIGLALWTGMLWSLFRGGIHAVRRFRKASPELAGRTVALTAMVIALLVPFVATTGFSLGYPWMLFGLLGAHVRLSKELTAT